MKQLEKTLQEVLLQDERLVSNENKLLKNKAIELALKHDKDILTLLASNKDTKKHFFEDVNKFKIFNTEKFVSFIGSKEFLPDSYTAFKNKIGLLNQSGAFISETQSVALSWPYKDCVLEGGQTKEESKQDEVFWNQTLAPDEINRLLEPKVLTSARRVDKDGDHDFNKFNRLKDNTISDNLIIKGNNLLALCSLKKEFAGKVKLVYIDPPFNTGNDSFKYNDRFNHSTWLTFMKNRLEVAKDLLSHDGNIFVHMDINESHYLKILLDEIFGRENFVEEIIWSYGSPSGGRAAGAKPVIIHNYILHYAKSYSERKQNKIYTPYSDKYIKDWFKHEDKDGRRYQRRMRGKDEEGNSVWEKQYLDESKGVPLTSVWGDIKQVYADPRAYKENQLFHTELIREFKGQKPEALIKRIVEMSTDKGDIILDFFAGSGTTGGVAHKMNRQFIIVEQMVAQINIQKKRFKKIHQGARVGISEDVDWQGGGSYVYLELAKWNQKLIGKIQKTKNKELDALAKTLLEKAHLSYLVDKKKFDMDEFKKLKPDEKRKILMEVLDKNQLYVNYSEMDDEDYGVADEEKRITRMFYGDE